MKKKIRAIYLDGMDKTGKTSILRELRKYLKSNEIDFYEVDGSGIDSVKKQELITLDNSKSLILKQNSILKNFHEQMASNVGIGRFVEAHREELRLEKCYNHDFGSVMFFLIPADNEAAKRIYGEEIPYNYLKLMDIYNNIGQTVLSQGLDIRPILIDKEDRIYDVRDKVLKILEKDFSLSS